MVAPAQMVSEVDMLIGGVESDLDELAEIVAEWDEYSEIERAHWQSIWQENFVSVLPRLSRLNREGKFSQLTERRFEDLRARISGASGQFAVLGFGSKDTFQAPVPSQN